MARKKTTIVRCDSPTCRNYEELETTEYPADWFRLQLVGTAGQLDQHVFEFCSAKCVKTWANERARVVHPEGNYPCGVCDFISTSVQGLRAHERNAHGLNVRDLPH